MRVCVRLSVLMALAAMLLVGAGSTAAANTYTDPQGRFSFTIPDGYVPVPLKLKPPVVVGYTSNNPPGPNFTVQARDFVGSGTLDGVTGAVLAEYVTSTGSMLVSDPQPLTLGGVPARRYEYLTTTDGTAYHIAQVVALNGTTLYIITFNAHNNGDYDSLIMQTGGMLASFMFATGNASMANARGPVPTSPPAATVIGGRYTDPRGLFSLTVPPGFSQEASSDPLTDVQFVARGPTGGLRAMVQITAFMIGSTATLESVAAPTREVITTRLGAESLMEQTIMFGGLAAQRFDYFAPAAAPGGRLRITQVITVLNGVAYLLTFTSDQSYYDDYAPQLAIFLSSFTIPAAGGGK